MTLEKKIHNVRYALTGLKIAWQEELNFKFEIVLGVIAVGFGWFLNITTTEWILVLIMIGLVLAAEVFNTALEELCDKFQSDPDPHIAKIKDLSAAAVLIASTTAFLVGTIIFIPHLL